MEGRSLLVIALALPLSLLIRNPLLVRPPCTLPLAERLPFVSPAHFLRFDRLPHFVLLNALGAHVADLSREGATV